MTCHRCHGFVCPVDLLDWASGSGHDSCRGVTMCSCGEIIDRVSVWNRICARDQRFVRRPKRPRQPIRTVPAISWPAGEAFIENRAQGSREGAVDDVVPICCFCSKVRDDTNMEVGKGPWIDLNTYAISRQLPLGQRFVFTHGYCPDCVAHFDERMAAYRPTTVWESLREAGRRLFVEAGGSQRDMEHL
jgi:hypothetical protein